MIKKKCIVIFGPEAVGKATIGAKLAEILGYQLLLYEDMKCLTYDAMDGFYPTVINRIAETLFRSISQTKVKGVIYAFPWNFATNVDRLYIQQRLNDLCVMKSNIYYVELTAPTEVRLHRNTLPDRIKRKRLKEDLEYADNVFQYMEKNGIYESKEGDFKNKNYIKIDTSKMSVDEAACAIISYLKLLGN